MAVGGRGGGGGKGGQRVAGGVGGSSEVERGRASVAMVAWKGVGREVERARVMDDKVNNER